jgi:hypothetical protein
MLISARARQTVAAAVAVVAGALSTAVSAGLPGYAGPAQALPGLTVELSPGSLDLKAGDRRTLTVTLIHSGPPARVSLTAAAPGGLSGDVTIASADSTCAGSGTSVTCTVEVAGDSQKSVLFTLAARNPDSLGAGQARTDTSGSVTATLGAGSTSLAYAVTLHGPAPAQTPTQAQGSTNAGSTGVTEVSGTVVDSGTGQPVPAAAVALQDGAGQTFQATTDSTGGYRFASSAARRIEPGTLTLTASRDQYGAAAAQTVQGRSGQSYTGIRISLDRTAGATPTSSDPGTASGGAYASPYRTASDPGWWSAALVGLGIVLILAGTGILVARVVRHRRARDAELQPSFSDAAPFSDAAVYGPAVDPWSAGTDPR